MQFQSISGDTEHLYNFTEDGAETRKLKDEFVVTADSNWGEGYSWAAIEASPAQNSALFFGELSTACPQDGRIARAGYVNFKSVTKRKAFGQLKKLDFEFYNAIKFKIRGDGRAYNVNIHVFEFLNKKIPYLALVGNTVNLFITIFFY